MINQIKSPWISANAGSGKTYTLSARVVRLMLLGVPPERILCLTYTKAAASEMRERVIKRLRELLLASDVECAKLVKDYIGEAGPDSVARARLLFGTLLDSASGGLQLTTIHGFCQSLLRRFPLEAGIAPHFAVLEDAAAERVQAKARHAVLDLESADDDLRAALEIVGSRGGEWHFDALAKDILGKHRQWENVWAAVDAPTLRARIFAAHGVDEHVTRDTLDDCLCNALGDADAAILRRLIPSMLAHKKKTEQKYGAGFARWLEVSVVQRKAHISKLISLCFTDRALRKDILKLAAADETGVIARFTEAMERYIAQTTALASAEESFAVAVMARALTTHYKAGKADIGALDYDDLISHTLALLAHPNTLGWVMQKLDHRIDHLLIDEAQDNSGEQWKIAYLLVEELMANGEGVGAGGLPRSLLVVGDEKQSIYSFQGAAPKEMAAYRAKFETILKDSPAALESQNLQKSYRSAASVLTLVDALCARPEVHAALGANGGAVKHVLHHSDMAGEVVLYPPIIAPEKEEVEQYTLPREYRVAQSGAEMLAEQIASTVEGWVKAGSARASDILILVHRRKPMVMPLLRALQARGVPVAGIDRLRISEHLAVRDMLALMQFVLNPADDLALAQVLRSPLVGMSDEELRAIAHNRAGHLWSEVENTWLAGMQAQRGATPYEFMARVLEVDGKRRDFARRFGNEVHEVLDELLEQAALLPAGMDATIANFHQFLSATMREVKREQESGIGNALRIMTVHGAKGLEAPIVILADTVSVPTTGRERSFFTRATSHAPLLPVLAISEDAKCAPLLERAKDEKSDALHEEYYRLLYVAATRAECGLHIFGTASKKGEVKQGSWYEALGAALRDAGAVEADGLLKLSNAGSKKLHEARELRETPPLPSWAGAQVVNEASAATLAPSRLQDGSAGAYTPNASADLRERGVRIHRILELAPPGADVAMLTRIANHIAPEWAEESRIKAVNEITALMKAEAWIWASAKRQPEASIAGLVEGIPFAGQVDLIVETVNEIAIIDYKTGSHVPPSAAEVPLSYVWQMKAYKALMQQIAPGKKVTTALLWTHGPKLMWMDEKVDATPFVTPENQAQSGLAA